jgi:hypothetical protein
MMLRALNPHFLVATLLTAVACAAPTRKLVPVSERSVKYDVPSFRAVPPTTETQKRGAITVQMVAPSFSVQRQLKTVCMRSKEVDVGGLTGAGVLYDVVTWPKVVIGADARDGSVVDSTEGSFQLTITNGLPQILKLEGVVFTAAVDGAEQPVDLYQDRPGVRRWILPNHAETFTFRGPAPEALPANAQMTFTVYDLVTATDPSGRPTRRERFSWQYTLYKERRVETGESRQERMPDTDPRFKEMCLRGADGVYGSVRAFQ